MDNPVTNEEFDEAYEVEERKPKNVRISLHMIQRRNIFNDVSSLPQDKLVEELNSITHLRLDRENITHIDSLELLGGNVTNLYLQTNQIKVIENLECLMNLRFLTLAENKIRKIQGLIHLPKLAFLDLSGNQIEDFDIDELPQSLKILNLRGNPCTNTPDYRGRILQDLASLLQLDGEDVTKEERRESGFVVSSDDDDESDDEKDEEFDYDDYVKDLAREKLELFEKTGITSGSDVLMQTSNDILERSQERVEDLYERHKQKMAMLDSIREYKNLPPSARSEIKVSAR